MIIIPIEVINDLLMTSIETGITQRKYAGEIL
jgi:hypothetical protein